MIYFILLCLYIYLLIKVISALFPRVRDLTKTFGLKISIIEFFIIALVLAYLFNYYYLQTTEYKNFIVPTQLIWISFASSILLFGIAIGAKLVLNLVASFVNIDQEITFDRNRALYDTFTSVWLNLSILMIFFSYSLMEISRPIDRINSLENALSIFILSTILGIAFFFMNKGIHPLVQRLTVLGMALVSICLILFTYESKVNFATNLPFTTSFICFNIAFFLSMAVHVILGFKFQKINLKSPFKRIKTSQDDEIMASEQVESFNYNEEIFKPATSMPYASNYQPLNLSINLDSNSDNLSSKVNSVNQGNFTHNKIDTDVDEEKHLGFEENILNSIGNIDHKQQNEPPISISLNSLR